MSLKDLQDEVATLASHLYAGTCRVLELVAELDRRGSWEEYGTGSCAEWLAWRCALLPRTAREHVRVARCLPELPLIHEAFARGELSYSKVRAITRIADPESEEDLLKLARGLTAAQLERAVRAYRRVTTDESEGHHFRAYLSAWVDANDSARLTARPAGARPRLPVPRLREPPVGGRPPRSSLGARGSTDFGNLVLLCRRHHRMLHEGGYRIDEQLRFYNPWGSEIPAVAHPPPGDAEALVRRDDVGPDTCEAGEGLDMDLDLAVEVLRRYTGVVLEE